MRLRARSRGFPAGAKKSPPVARLRSPSAAPVRLNVDVCSRDEHGCPERAFADNHSNQNPVSLRMVASLVGAPGGTVKYAEADRTTWSIEKPSSRGWMR